MFQSIEPQVGASALVPHPNRLTLLGTPAEARFPPLCPNCGGHAAGKISCSKVFSRAAEDGPAQYVVTTADVSFCDACIAVHRSHESKPARFELLIASFSSVHVIGAVFPALAAIFLAKIALKDIAHGQVTRSLVELGFGAAAALIAWGQGWSVWRDRERFRVPPQTDVTKAFDFSDDTAPVFEARRFDCTMRDSGFANAFRMLNLENEYLPQSARAISDRRRSSVFLWIFGAVVAVTVLWGFFEDLFG